MLPSQQRFLSCRAGNILKRKIKQVSKKPIFCYNEDSAVEILCIIPFGQSYFLYVVHSYNFFLFPSTLGIRDVEFTLSASSIQFLSHYGFDYNKFLKDGIPYMNEVQEKILRQHLLAGTWKVSCIVVIDFHFVLLKPFSFFFPLVVCLIGYQMLDVQLVLRQALENVWTDDCSFQVMVKKVSPEHRQLLENSSYDHCQKKLILLSARGFTNLFQILVKAKKPLVGHNMLMDLMHLHDKFYRPLPESYEEFKRNIHNLFPVIIDTKTVTKYVQKVRCTYLFLFEVQTCVLPERVYLSSVACDNRTANSSQCCLGNDAVEADPSFSQYLTVLAEHVNKVNFIRGGVSSINFSGEDAPCHHPPALVVRVRGWPGLTERQIYHEFKARCRFDVRRLSKNQFILLSNKYKQVRLVLRDYRHHPHLQVSIYRHWRHSPSVNCLLQISGIVALWSLLAFALGGARSC
uniref:PARN like, ribonuclease domain containing 1 n=1 Tax=Zosterops lateralis melanops TaxID=1220523 RepID=A0A8D2QQ97_ZOSLA